MAGKQQSRSRKTEAVEEAAQGRIDDDAPAPAGDDDNAPDDESGGSGIALAREFESQNFELSDEQLAEVIGQNAGDDDTGGLLGRIGREDVQKGKPGDDLLRGGEDNSEPEAPFSDRPAAFEAGPDVREAGVFDLLDQPGADTSDPLSSFLGAVEGKLGRDTRLTTPSDDQGDAKPKFGTDAISSDGSASAHYYTDDGSKVTTYDDGTVAVDSPDGGAFTLWTDGSWEYMSPGGIHLKGDGDGNFTAEKDGEVIASGNTNDPPESSTEDPGPDGESVPLPEELQAQLDADLARLRELREQGPDSGDGATDPSEIESEVVGVPGDLPTHAELGQSLFGQPPSDGVLTGGGDANVNPGADSQGAGVITPQDDQNVAVGPTRNDDRFDAAGPAPKPIAADAADDADDADEGAASFLPPSEIDSRVETPGDDLPDEILFDPSAP